MLCPDRVIYVVVCSDPDGVEQQGNPGSNNLKTIYQIEKQQKKQEDMSENK